jgi:Na+/melibiose symporter-like transporter
LTVLASFIIVYGDAASFVRYATIAVIVILVMMILLFLGVKESEEMKQMFLKSTESAEELGFFKTMKISLKTKNFAVSLLGYTAQITAMTLWTASGIYMYKDVYRLDYTASALPSIVGVLCVIFSIPFWSNYARKHGFKKTYWTAFILHGLAFIPFLFITSFLLVIIFTGIMYIFYCGEVIMLMPVASDTYDEVATRVGKRVDATMVGIRTFFFRVAFFIQAIVFFLVHTLTMYDPDPAAVQTPLAVWGVRVHAALIPMLIFIAMGIIFRKFYTLEGAEKEALVRKLKDMGLYR